MPTLTFQPSSFGRIRNTGSSNWATVRDAATGSAVTIPSTQPAMTGKDGSGNFFVDRGVLIADTSTIPDNAILLATCRWELYATSKGVGDDDGDDWLNLSAFTPSDPTNVTTADFNDFGTVEKSTRIDISTGITTSAYNTWIINDLTLINKSGYTVMGMREGHDFLNNAYAGANNTQNFAQFQVVGDANPPLLIIDYTVPGGLVGAANV